MTVINRPTATQAAHLKKASLTRLLTPVNTAFDVEIDHLKADGIPGPIWDAAPPA